VEGLVTSLSKISLFKKINFLSKLNFKNAKALIVKKIKGIRSEDRASERSWKIVGISRNEDRPKTLDYINNIFEDFVELSGDRISADDRSITAGLGRFEGKTVALIGHNKGKDIKERVEYNFGMPNPSGYRKSKRIMELANRFNFPVITFIDTPGANPAIEAEDNGQAGAIARNIEFMFNLKVPSIVIFIGEGGSGGALALAIGNYIMMLENSTYSVISPEGCASILWRDSGVAKLAARALKLTSRDLLKLGVIDRIIYEPMGGAQKSPERTVRIVRNFLVGTLKKFDGFGKDYDFKAARAAKFERMGYFNSPQKV
jgi:acetyl-CoA carboxylase carboxyl transferase subunit alpha